MADIITADALSQMTGISHGFFTRNGGVSDGIYASLNCGQGSDDDRHAVAENRRRVATVLGVSSSHLLSVHQIHSPEVITVSEIWEPGERPRADAMVTARRGVALGILAADCGPILFADPDAGVVGAAHAGWRGAVGGVLEATVAAMEGLGAERGRITAVLGPTIAQPSYEVGPEFPEPFLDQDPDNGRFFRPSHRPGHHMFDLPGYIVARLTRCGLRHADQIGRDTCAEAESFFSYRRTTLDGVTGYGRNISAILLER